MPLVIASNGLTSASAATLQIGLGIVLISDKAD
jgi:hypothetical protein